MLARSRATGSTRNRNGRCETSASSSKGARSIAIRTRDAKPDSRARNRRIVRRFAQVPAGPLESHGGTTRRGTMSDITFYTNPMSRGRIVHWLLEELGVPYDMKILDFEKGDHKKRRVLEDQSDGQGAGDRASRHRRHGERRDLPLSRGRVPQGRLGAGARRSAARHVRALAVFRRGLLRARDRRQDVRAGPPSSAKACSATAATRTR